MEIIMVYSTNEWDPLKQVILGTARGMYWPKAKGAKWEALPVDQHIPSYILEETEEGLEQYSNAMKSYGVEVLRPKYKDYSTINGFGAYSTRDTIAIIGDKVIFTPTRFEYRRLEWDYMMHLFPEDSNFIYAPLDQPDLYFDAANIIRCDQDILYLVSGTGSIEGGRWLQDILGKEYRVHILENLYSGSHLDSTIVPLCEGSVLLNAGRCSEDHLPDFLKKWDKIWVTDEDIIDYKNDLNIASKWVGMNVFVIAPNLVAVDSTQTVLIDKLRSLGILVEPVNLPYARYLLGGPHCTTLDTIRKV